MAPRHFPLTMDWSATRALDGIRLLGNNRQIPGHQKPIAVLPRLEPALADEPARK